MNNYELEKDEVILMDTDEVNYNSNNLHLILTSKKIIFEQTETKGLFKTQTKTKIIDIIMLDNIKIYKEKVQVKQKGCDVFIQTIEKNFSIIFDSRIDAMKFVTKIIDTLTDTTISDRGANKVKKAINKVDDVLGFDTRGTVKGVLENGLAGSVLKGIKKKKK